MQTKNDGLTCHAVIFPRHYSQTLAKPKVFLEDASRLLEAVVQPRQTLILCLDFNTKPLEKRKTI